jgi:hypothetical protein
VDVEAHPRTLEPAPREPGNATAYFLLRQEPVEGTVTLASDRSKKPIGSPSLRSQRPTAETFRRAALSTADDLVT